MKKKRKRKINKKEHEKEELRKRKDKNKTRKRLGKEIVWNLLPFYFYGVSVTYQRGCLTIFVVSKFSKLSLLRSEYFLHTNIPKNYLKVSKFYFIKNGQNEENTNRRTKKANINYF